MEKLSEVWGTHAKDTFTSYGYPNLKEISRTNDLLLIWMRGLKQKGLKHLDAGSGIGQYVVAGNLLGFSSEGLDISKEAVKIAKENEVKVIEGDMRDLPYSNETFDLVTAGGSLEHFPETKLGVKEIHRVLKDGGIIVGNVPHKYTTFSISRKIQQLLGTWKVGYEKPFSTREFKKILKESGFKKIEIRRRRTAIGKHKLLSGTLRLLDESLFLIGFGGAHFYFKAIK